MTRLLPFLATTALAATLVSVSRASAETPYRCGEGTVRDAEAIVETVALQQETRTVRRRNRRGDTEVVTRTGPSERHERAFLITIELDDVLYTARSSGNFWNFDPTQLVVNDAVGVCVDRNHVVLRRPDGKDYKARIIRAVRTRSPQ